MADQTSDQARIKEIYLDEKTVVNRTPQVEHERKVAIYDLLDNNHFALHEGPPGPYVLRLSIVENRLQFDVRDENNQPIKRFMLALSSFRAIVREYLMVCDSYYKAIKTSSPSQIEAIDMGRRGLHNDGSEILEKRLLKKVELDHNTARRLFTLVCVLHIRA